MSSVSCMRLSGCAADNTQKVHAWQEREGFRLGMIGGRRKNANVSGDETNAKNHCKDCA